MANPNIFVNTNHHLVEALSGDDQDKRPKKKKFSHRHTQHQIQEMETIYKGCTHPDDKQQKDLARCLSLDPVQVKFCFQNKRAQMKAHRERHENTLLRIENDKLRAEIIWYKEAIGNATCQHCGGDVALGEMSVVAYQLRIENVRLREEINRILSIAAKNDGKSNLIYSNLFPRMAHSVYNDI